MSELHLLGKRNNNRSISSVENHPVILMNAFKRDRKGGIPKLLYIRYQGVGIPKKSSSINEFFC